MERKCKRKHRIGRRGWGIDSESGEARDQMLQQTK